jgi:hypothetical protein
MEIHCNSIVYPMPKKKREPGESKEFSITLPIEAVEMIEEGLIPFGLYGKMRATICRRLILDVLTTTKVQQNIREGREKAAKRIKDAADG